MKNKLSTIHDGLQTIQIPIFLTVSVEEQEGFLVLVMRVLGESV